jgi:uncharacterized membrane protein YdjX (TVP38/TMEM64 family)
MTMQADTTPPFSPRTLIFGIGSFVIVTLVMLFFIEWIGVESIQVFIEEAGPLAPLAYIGLKIATYVFAPLSSGPVQLSSGILFGLWGGTLYTLIGEVLGGTISFLIARHLGRPVVRRFVGDDGMARVDNFVNQLGSGRALIYARLFLFAIYDFISYAAGFSKTITLRQYVLVSTVIGVIPTFLFVGAGASLAGNRVVLVFIYFCIGMLSALPFLLNRRRKPRQPLDSTAG